MIVENLLDFTLVDIVFDIHNVVIDILTVQVVTQFQEILFDFVVHLVMTGVIVNVFGKWRCGQPANIRQEIIGVFVIFFVFKLFVSHQEIKFCHNLLIGMIFFRMMAFIKYQ